MGSGEELAVRQKIRRGAFALHYGPRLEPNSAYACLDISRCYMQTLGVQMIHGPAHGLSVHFFLTFFVSFLVFWALLDEKTLTCWAVLCRLCMASFMLRSAVISSLCSVTWSLLSVFSLSLSLVLLSLFFPVNVSAFVALRFASPTVFDELFSVFLFELLSDHA